MDFIGEGRGSQALAKAPVETERRVESLTAEVDALRRSREKVFRTPPIEWISDRMSQLQEVLEQRTACSAQALREILGPIRMQLVTPDIGQPFYRAITSIDALALTESPPAGAEGGSNSLQRWGRRVRKARNSLSPSGDSVAVSGRVVAESIVCVCPLVAVRGEWEVQSLSRPVLVGMLVKRHDEATAVGVAELDGDTDRRQAALEQQRRARMA